MPEHPWRQTLGELISYVRSNFGQEPAEAIQHRAALRGDDYDDVLEEDVLRGYIRDEGLHLEDFGFEEDLGT